MTRELNVTRRAAGDIEHIASQLAIGRAFLARLGEMLAIITESPELWPLVAGEEDVRRAVMTPARFGNYLVFFRASPHVVAILRIVDGRRRPRTKKTG